ncbi:hypothetical protein [Paracraurococcus ruber]|uniref:Lipoprotein n=1 Tax=Paracraurococcus ruber TaxID=77675 RepID=A0ABS1CYL1_9PROT|nr:hypothetical protein [Paracraurococcus ruber]MBK1659625.1 hypothetical protein [Paracraurococcus ruber]TDG29374.1 hypothetical protein E2C05_17965 [Paracraurococcus ruber]
MINPIRTVPFVRPIVVVLCCLTLAACGQQAASSYAISGSRELAPKRQPDATSPLLVVRFPARVTPAAKPKFEKLYETRGFTNIFYRPDDSEVVVPWAGLNANQRPADMTGASTEALSKTAQLALDIYQDLSARLPNGAVRLQPTEIDLRQTRTSGGLPMSLDGWPDALYERSTVEYPPAAIYLDVFAFVDPYHRTGTPTTFGSLVAPLVTIRTSPAAVPATGGAIAIPDAFLPYTRAVRSRAPAARGRGVTFIEYLNSAQGVPADGETLPPDRLTEGLDGVPGKVLVLPVAQFDLGTESLSTPSKVKEAQARLFSAYQQIVVTALNGIDPTVALEADRRRYVALFDPQLAARVASGQAVPGDTERMSLLRQFERAEWRMLSLQDEDFIRNTVGGTWGNSMAEVRRQEERFRQDLERARSRAEMASMVTFMSGAMSNMALSRVNPMQATMNNLQLSMTTMAQQQAANQELADITRSFVSRIEGIYRESVRFTFEVAGQTFEVQARSLGELRARMRKIYETQRSSA